MGLWDLVYQQKLSREGEIEGRQVEAGFDNKLELLALSSFVGF